MAKTKPTIVWFRSDLRLADNPALQMALSRARPIIPVFIWAPHDEAPWAPGAASRWWLHQSLRELAETLRSRGSRLILYHGPAEESLRAFIYETGADAVYWNRRYEPAVIARDTKIKSDLCGEGIEVETFNAALLNEPWKVQNKSGRPFRVFTRILEALPFVE
jgi:deoxyribodipyrimidine photo-lyase